MNGFAKRLDFLMSLTDTKNTVLGRALNFDPSYISRIRSGKRGIPRNEPFIEPAAFFFARKINGTYMREMAANVISPGKSWPDNLSAASGLISAFLSDGTREDEDADATSLKNSPERSARHYASENGGTGTTASFFYGNEGKREIVARFLDILLEEDVPHTLYLASDEDLTWLFEDNDYTLNWGRKMMRLSENGSRIHMVHTLDRNLDEMIKALSSWMPLYAYGSVIPYYCPKVRDNIYHRTLFIAKGKLAAFSDSIGDEANGMLNVLISDRTAVRALEKEYRVLLRFCRPLMKVFTKLNKAEFRQCETAFNDTPGTLFESTLPQGIIIRIKEEAGAIVELPSDDPLRFYFTERRVVASLLEYITRGI